MGRPFVVAAALVLLSGCGAGSGTTDQPAAPLVATLGDSYTEGAPRWIADSEARESVLGDRATPRSQWQYWAQKELGGALRFRNCGISGERTDEIELRFEPCLEDAEIVVVQGGTNDIVQGKRPAAAVAKLRAMVRRGRAAGLRTLVTTVPPLNYGYPRWAAEIRRLNDLIRALARREEVALIEFFDVLEDPRRPGRMRADWTADRAHPTVEGYARMGRIAARALRPSPRRTP